MREPELKTLGTLDLRVGGAVADEILGRSKHLALLAFLAAERPVGAHRREVLMALLWPESDEARARRSLRQALYEIRGALGQHAIRSPSSERIVLGQIRCDARAFWDLHESGRLEEAIELYRGEFLPGFHLNHDGGEFERWLTRTRSAFSQTAFAMASVLSERASGGEDWLSAARWAKRALEFAPYDELALRHVLTAYERAGDRPAAVQEYERFASRLAMDLRITPGEETLGELDRIRGGGGTRKHAKAGQPSVEPPAAEPVPTTASGPAGRSSGAAPSPGARTVHRPLWVALGILMLAAMSGGVLWTLRERAEGPATTLDPRRVVVSGFVNESDESALDPIVQLASDWILQGVTELGLAEVLSRSPAAVAGNPAVDTRDSPDRAMAASLVLGGSVYRLGDTTILQARILERPDGEVVWASAVAWDEDGTAQVALRTIREELMTALAERLEPRLGSAGQAHVDDPPGLDAYRAFAEGVQTFATAPSGGFAESIPHFERAHALDSSFSLPLIWAALAHDSEWRLVGGMGPHHAEARDSLLSVLDAGRDALTELERRFLAYVSARIADEPRVSFEAALRLAQITTGPEYLKLIADAAYQNNEPADVVALLEAADPRMESLPGDEKRAQMLAHALHQIGAYERELEAAARARRIQGPRTITPWFAQARALAALGRRGSLDSLLAHVDSAMNRMFHRFHFGRLLLESGLELAAHGHENWEVLLEAVPPTFERASRNATGPLAERLTAARLGSNFTALLALGRLPAAQIVADSLAAFFGADVHAGIHPRAVIAAARGDRQRALELESLLRRRSDHTDSFAARARVHALLGNRQDAIRILGIGLAGRSPGWMLHRDPAFRSLLDDPEFRRLVGTQPE